MSNIKNKNSSKIIGIQFSILSPDEIRNNSVVEVTNRDTYINNKPVLGGLFDPRMGVLEPGIICPTDGLDYINTPGYFGHIELAKPVFYIQYLPTITKILKCVCFKCSKLLISKEKYNYLLEKPNEERWNTVFTIASKVKRCGDETNNGCGCKQPDKIKKEEISTLIAEWNNKDEEPISTNLQPELIIRIFKRISDDDITFMGFSPIWSRPDSMVCQVLAIPPPAVRPSVKHDAQQRSEDDLSHILVNIIKTNKTLQEKIQQNAPGHIIDDWSKVLQYFIATLIDNKLPGVDSVRQRSGRPFKSLAERLKGKGGRVRGNLQGKRVDFSARSVITPDPQLSIKELGVPMKIAKNITKPIIVNDKNKEYLFKLIKNGPDVYPGAKILEKKNGDNISLRYIDTNSIVLENGDIVHRHMMDGDYILFNRQPTLHRMSMMSHIVKIMPKGDTFRMNVGDTKPYNADFDGDEMNLHMPQDIEAEIELKHLAAVPYQIISPANNKSIIGIFQDSLLGSYRLTRGNLKPFDKRTAMNLLMNVKTIDVTKLQDKRTITNFDLLTQIMPPLTIQYKNKLFDSDKEDFKTSNNVISITNGTYNRGHIDKDVLGSNSRGLIQRICNDFGNEQSTKFIDDLQNIVTEYMKISGYSVGIGDLISDDNTNKSINNVINEKKKEVKNLIDQVHLGLFENKTGKTNDEEFETQVNNILNKAENQVRKIARESLSKDNKFVIMVNAGSKGSDLNISQMISCLSQQNVDGKRIPYGFDNRTLPHFNKFDDSPNARGFVENSFISGLTPEELFFHAMGGRVGLIDTAVKTSQTGYIQRRLIKGLEDLKVEYDMTVRNNKNKIVQFSYGEDGIDTVKVENQVLSLIDMTIQQIYEHYDLSLTNNDKYLNLIYIPEKIKSHKSEITETKTYCKKYIDMMIERRDDIITKIFNNMNNNILFCPVSFVHIINNIQGQFNLQSKSLIDITPLEMFKMLEDTIKKLNLIHYNPPTKVFETLFYYYLSPKDILFNKKFNKSALTMLLETIIHDYKKSIVNPGEMVGIIAGQSIGEPTTQMTLNTFHFAGVASKSNVTRGVPRIEEILSLSSEPKNPSLTIYLKHNDEISKENANEIRGMIEYTKLRELIDSATIYFDPDNMETLITKDELLMKQYKEFESVIDDCIDNNKDQTVKELSKYILRFELNVEEMLDKNITMDDIDFALTNSYGNNISCVFSDYNDTNLIFRIRLDKIKKFTEGKENTIDASDEIYYLRNFQETLLDNTIIRGVRNIKKVICRKIPNAVYKEEGNYVKKEIWVLDTVGSNLFDVLELDYIDNKRTITNNIQEVYNVLGIEAARQSIFNEISDVMEFDSTYINYHHLSLLCDRMTMSYKMISIFRHGINNDNIGPIAKASFEETPEMFLKAAKHSELDEMRGVSANIMCGQEGYFGTNSFQTYLDLEKYKKLNIEATQLDSTDDDEDIDRIFGEIDLKMSNCNMNSINIDNNLSSFKVIDLGCDDDYDITI